MAVLFDRSQLPPTALLAMSDLAALKAMAWLTARRWRVPQDVSVVGFDSVPEAALADPPLTTVEQPYRRIAERAVAAILEDALPQGRQVLPFTLVIRKSTGPAPE